MSDKQPATLTVSGLSAREADKLADEYGGDVEMCGFLRYKLTIHGEMTEERFAEIQAKFGTGEAQ